MKVKTLKPILYGGSLLFSLLARWKVYADDVTYEYVSKHLKDITSKVWFGNDWFGLNSEMLYLINKFVQAVFWFAKLSFQIFGGLYEKLTDAPKYFADYINEVISATASMFSGLQTVLLPIIGALMAVYLSYVYFVKNGSFIKTMVRLFVIFACALLYFSQSNGDYMIARFYRNTTSITSNLSSTLSNSLTNTKVSTSGSEAVLNEYAKSAIWLPYSYINSDVDKKASNGFQLTEGQLQSLVDYSDGQDDFKVKDDKGEKGIKEVAGEEKKPTNSMLKSNWGAKFTYALVAVIESTFVGLMLAVFAITQFMMNVSLLILLMLAPIGLILSMVPTFENILLNLTKKIAFTIVTSGLITFFATLALYFNGVLVKVTTAIGFNNVLIGYVLKAIVLVIVYRKRNSLLSILTDNRITHVSNRLTRSLDRAGHRVKEQTLGKVQKNSQAKLALAGATIAGASTLAKQGIKSKTKSAMKTGFNRSSQALSESLARRKATQAEAQGQSYEVAYKQAKAQNAYRSERLQTATLSLQKGLHKTREGIYTARNTHTGKDEDLVKATESRNKAQAIDSHLSQKRQEVTRLRQSAYNQETKERIKAQRKARNGQTISHFKDSYLVQQELSI